MTPFRLAVAGAGAVVERFHLPAARLCPEIRVVALADTNLGRARTLAARFGIPRVTADYRELADGTDGADGVLVALPNFLHAPAAIEFLRRGMPVLVEKPMALGVAEAEEMIRAGTEGKAVLAVGLVGRHASGARWIKRAAAEGLLGPLQSVELEYGAAFSWQPASSFLFSKEQAGGGVLIDMGSHMLDLTVWWAGEPALLEYRDDSMGGLEAECSVVLSFGGPTASVNGAVSLSRLRTLANTVRIAGERRSVEWDIATDTVRVRSSAGHVEASVPGFPQPPRRAMREMFADQLRAFAAAVAGLDEPTASGENALTIVELIERCYRERRPVVLPWTRPALSV
jgi:predicted dehydrogenase